MLTKARKIFLAAVVALSATAITLAVLWYRDYPVRHFGVVEKNAFYRGAQPEAGGWRRLRDDFGIRTVIDLREDRSSQPWAVAEREFCDRNGIRYVKLPVGSEGITDAELRTIVETVGAPACRPVFIHCELGKSRTGVAVAAYRIVVHGWTLDAAIAEAAKYKENMTAPYIEYLKQLAGGNGWRPPRHLTQGTAPSSPATPAAPRR
jgi:protein tyrosine phosphatase (PTP) superfamily phosphohydrolase (DUF442 family)